MRRQWAAVVLAVLPPRTNAAAAIGRTRTTHLGEFYLIPHILLPFA